VTLYNFCEVSGKDCIGANEFVGNIELNCFL
jgi:hypothetical protein